MSQGSSATQTVHHDTIRLERHYQAPPARVFAAWADPVVRRRWSAPEDGWEIAECHYDFRVGGRETSRFGPPGAPLYSTDTRYEDIVPDERIISAGTMSHGEKRVFSGLLTVELLPAGRGTRLILTEQGAFLGEGGTPADHERGWRAMLEKIDAELRATEPTHGG
jgi:uncharacterized protein YndB with AHSA1/START domain